MQVPAAGSIEDFINVENGLGKFEGETGLANWYWQCVLDGDGEAGLG